MKNTVYYIVKKELKNNTKKIDTKTSTQFIKDIDKLSRSILELGINNKDNIVIEKSNSIKFLEIIYAFNKLGLSIILIDNETNNKRDIISEANYLFVNNIEKIDIDSYKKIILYNSIGNDEDTVMDWNKFYDISKYYNKEIVYFDNFNIKYYDNNIELNLKDEDILNSLDELDSRLGIKNNNICLNYIDFVLINYLILNNNISFDDGNILFTKDNILLNNLIDNKYDKVYSKFDMINEYELSKIIDRYSDRYNRYFSFYNKFICIGKDELKLFNVEDIKICNVINNKKSSFGSIEIKINKKNIKTNYVGNIDNNNLNIVDYLNKEIEREKLRKTGLPEIDMPWCKYYPEESKNDKVLPYTLYQNLKELNKDNYLEVALKYLGEEMTTRIINKINNLNNIIEKDSLDLGRGYRIGHSYFTPTEDIADVEFWYRGIIKMEIEPLIREYWFDRSEEEIQQRVDDLLGK